MPTEQQYDREQLIVQDDLIPWGDRDPWWKGNSYTDYIRTGSIREVFANWAEFVWALASESPSEGYKFAMELGGQEIADSGQLSPDFPTGEWKLGGTVQIISNGRIGSPWEGKRLSSVYQLITASQSIAEAFVNAPTMLDPDSKRPNYGVLAAVYALQISEQTGMNMPWDKIGLWKQVTFDVAPQPTESYYSERARFGATNGGNGKRNVKSIIPWLAIAALAAGLMS
jgi:hypothetical protein